MYTYTYAYTHTHYTIQCQKSQDDLHPGVRWDYALWIGAIRLCGDRTAQDEGLKPHLGLVVVAVLMGNMKLRMNIYIYIYICIIKLSDNMYIYIYIILGFFLYPYF